MQRDQNDAYSYDANFAEDYYGKGINGYIHKRGGEIDCSLSGRFFHMEIDMSAET